MTGDRASEENDMRFEPVTDMPLGHVLVALLGAVITASMIGTLIFEGVRNGREGADFQFSVISVEARSSGHEVRFELENTGKSTARALEVEVSLMTEETVVETASTTLDYAPDGARRTAAVFFERDPADYEISFQPQGYDTP